MEGLSNTWWFDRIRNDPPELGEVILVRNSHGVGGPPWMVMYGQDGLIFSVNTGTWGRLDQYDQWMRIPK